MLTLLNGYYRTHSVHLPVQNLFQALLFLHEQSLEIELIKEARENASTFLFLGTKTLVVHGQNECDIPTQLPVHEDTQFEALLKVGVGF